MWHRSTLAAIIASGLAFGAAPAAGAVTETRFYQIVDGRVDGRTYNGFRRYHAGCNHCHGPDGVGSTFSPSLVDGLPGVDAFRRAVLDGRISATSAMQGFAGDPNAAGTSSDSSDRSAAPSRSSSSSPMRPTWLFLS